ncbi:uncharacterized protein LOC113322219 isoform X1 [Papaver somniferum]|nr:uncharacterized protein LOC113322219 isoform X1 [Papaver somniferum]XP_026426052.1 uncharacterized protein LOC113322219 isoform X1 [Papaver somniferum]XP_026426054.1 uncharacterized protein LOC113322219 isoform X1 [Papaver somniferum]XP_026426055.1 uncharacterized protein LOC113322219 isoform X1 [Papaver somniferum]XP_026426056.1 uncharacterized protein LOC113322219 isoform X1 [Papaver somniferum]XP_026426057.1 uncharacterized protein LOC113322219 isoform X1 [Papaver somniferum]XP_02642605
MTTSSQTQSSSLSSSTFSFGTATSISSSSQFSSTPSTGLPFGTKAAFGSSAGPSTSLSSGGGSQQPPTQLFGVSTSTPSFGVSSASTTTTPAFGIRKTVAPGGSSLSGSTSGAPMFSVPSFGAAPSTSSAVSNATPAFTMPSFGAPTAAAAAPSTTITASPGFTTSNLLVTPSSAASRTSTAAPFSSMSTAASSSSPISKSTVPFGTGSALSYTTASFTQTTSPASVAPAATSSSTTTLATFSVGTPPLGFKPASAATTTNAVSTGVLSSPAPAKPMFSASTVTTIGPVLSASAATATTTKAVSTGAITSPAPAKPVISASRVTTTVPVLSASAATATPATTTNAVSTGAVSSPAPAKRIVSASTITTKSPVVSASIATATPATTTKAVSAGAVSSPAPAKPKVSASTITTKGPVLSASTATATPATTTNAVSTAAVSRPASAKPMSTKGPVLSARMATAIPATTTNAVSPAAVSRPAPAKPMSTKGPVLSARMATATPATTTGPVTTGVLSSPAPTKPVAAGLVSKAFTTTPASPAQGLFSSLAGPAANSAGSTPSITTPKREPELVVRKVPNPEFYNFRNKTKASFEVGQKWAIYVDLDHMPKKYVCINKVYSPFKVDVTWLEFIAGDINETAWKTSGLPVACGKFRYGKNQKTDTITDVSSFSHKVFKNKSVSGNCDIYPRKGETWALYKNWNIKWSSDPNNHREYEYEFVVVLSDYSKKSGILVAYLVKLKGFVCLFKPTNNNGMASFQIPSNQMLRFSHRVPSNRTNGKERKDVPEGYFELDPCCLLSNLKEVSEFIDRKAEVVDGNNNGSSISVSKYKHPVLKKRKNPDTEITLDGSSRGGNKSSRMSDGCYKNPNEENRAAEASRQPQNKSKATSVSDGGKIVAAHAKEMSPDGMNAIPGSVDEVIPSSLSLKFFELLDTEFCNFDEERSCEKFKTGQVWALYYKLDKFPKTYVQIECVESFPVFKLYAKWLKSCDPPRRIIPWVDKEMPVSCGTFKVTSSEVVFFYDSISFSHQVSGVPTANNVYTILPRAGEVWAVYSKFRSDLTCSDLKKCEYDIVEILEVVDVHWIIVSVLERVAGFKTIFKAKQTEGLDSTAAIPWIELYRFSHQVPSFMISGARYGKLRGCWELDIRSLAASDQPLDKSKSTSVPNGDEYVVAPTMKMSLDGVISIPGNVGEDIPSSPSSLKTIKMPVTKFCNFDVVRSCEMFKTGQIWALYCKMDKLPKTYAQIESFKSFPGFKLVVKLLKSCDPPRSIIPWVDKEMPVSCGTFKVTSSELVVFKDSISFSHQLSKVPAVNNVYTIYPKAGEVWALYRKFRSDLTCSDLKKCEYDIVEILEVVDVHWIIVSVIQRVAGFKTIFKAKEKEGLDSTAAIPWLELYRFSHQIPSFILSGARCGQLRGCWELDPRSLSVYRYSMN